MTSRLDAALQAHEATLRRELDAARRKQHELEAEVVKLGTSILDTEQDLREVESELVRRGIQHHRRVGYIVTEEP